MSNEYPIEAPLLKSFPFTAIALYSTVKAGLLYSSLILLFTLCFYLNANYTHAVFKYSYLFTIAINVMVMIYVLIHSTEFIIKKIMVGVCLLIALYSLVTKDTNLFLICMGISFLLTIHDRDINSIMRTLYLE